MFLINVNIAERSRAIWICTVTSASHGSFMVQLHMFPETIISRNRFWTKRTEIHNAPDFQKYCEEKFAIQ